MPASSASPELRAMVFCVVDQCLMVWDPHMAAPPRVERRVDMQPAKSASVYTIMPGSPFCHGKWYTALGRCS
eukprot:21051-Alexandrium_andersonii.AAC.1